MEFELAEGHDFGIDASNARLASGPAAGQAEHSPSAMLVAVMNETWLSDLADISISYDEWQLAYVTHDGEGARVDVDDLPGAGVEVYLGWAGGISDESRTVQVVFAYDAPWAKIELNASWTKGVVDRTEKNLSSDRVHAVSRADFDQGTSAGAYYLGSASLELAEKVDADHGLVGAFWPISELGLSDHGCSSPVDPSTCYVGYTEPWFFSRASGAWEFWIDTQVVAEEEGLHQLLAVELPDVP